MLSFKSLLLRPFKVTLLLLLLVSEILLFLQLLVSEILLFLPLLFFEILYCLLLLFFEFLRCLLAIFLVCLLAIVVEVEDGIISGLAIVEWREVEILLLDTFGLLVLVAVFERVGEVRPICTDQVTDILTDIDRAVFDNTVLSSAITSTSVDDWSANINSALNEGSNKSGLNLRLCLRNSWRGGIFRVFWLLRLRNDNLEVNSEATSVATL